MAAAKRHLTLTALDDFKYGTGQTLLQRRPAAKEERKTPSAAQASVFSPVQRQSPARARSSSLAATGTFGGKTLRASRSRLAWGRSGSCEGDEDPLSPLSSLVNRTCNERPGFAVVRQIPLREVELPHAEVEERPLSRMSSATAPFPELVRSHCTSTLRPLTSSNVREKETRISQLFHEAENLNRRARSKESVGELLEHARQHRVEAQREEVLRSRNPSKDAPTLLLAEPVAPAPTEAAPTAPQKVNLMEKFGYGVKVASQAPKPSAIEPMEVPPPKKSNFIALEFKRNDLKARLAARRHTVE